MAWFCAGPAQAAQVNGLRVWADPEKTRAVLDLSASAEYRLFQLDNPTRVVIDLDNSQVKNQLRLDKKVSGVISGVRHGVHEGSHSRVVLEIKGKVEPRSFMLEPVGEYGHRLVVDLYKKGAPSTVKRAADYAQEKNRDVIIAIDAGHGGEDPGASGPNRTREKNVVLAISRELKKVIDKEPGMRAVLTRDGDYFIPHRQRYEKAREARADLFVSVHADAFYDRRVSGSSVYVLSRRGASSEAARRLADRENQSDLIGGVSLSDKDDVLASVLLDLSQNAAMQASNHAAAAVLDGLKQVGKTHKKRVEHANFLVLKSPDVPSILVETAFISNPNEERRLNDPAYQKKLAKSIASGVRDYFRTTPPPGTWFAANRAPSRHLVSRGDTLTSIAQRYRVSTTALRAANRLKNDRILVGKELLIPSG